jgi:hypothetical protein
VSEIVLCYQGRDLKLKGYSDADWLAIEMSVNPLCTHFYLVVGLFLCVVRNNHAILCPNGVRVCCLFSSSTRGYLVEEILLAPKGYNSCR